jgi:hypothetical protein
MAHEHSEFEYPKIDTLYNRDLRHHIMLDKLRNPEVLLIKEWQITEKINGRNTRITLFDNGDIKIGGRSDDAEIPDTLLLYLHETFTPEKLKKAFWTPNKVLPVSVTLYGEGYGPDMTPGSGIYRKDPSFRLFDCMIKTSSGSEGHGLQTWWLERKNLEDVARKLGIKCVPLLGTIRFLPCSIQQVTFLYKKVCTDLEANSVVAMEEQGQGVIPEGLVARTEPLLFNRRGDRLMWKIKVKDFQ